MPPGADRAQARFARDDYLIGRIQLAAAGALHEGELVALNQLPASR